jgi:hypothetical protein
MNRRGFLVLTAVAVVAANPATAHHSFAMYDMARTESASGTIKEFRWGAPHSSVLVTIKAADGQARDISLLSGSPLAFSKQGFNPKSIKVGDKVQLSWHPNWNGSFGGVVATMKFPNGGIYTESEIAPGVPGAGGPPGAPPAGGPPPGGRPNGGGRPAD